jgi:predicted Zn-dependent protease
VRRSLAAAELKLGKPADAAKEAEASLKQWPQDGLALQVLASAQKAMGKDVDAQRSEAERQKWWRGKPLGLDLI